MKNYRFWSALLLLMMATASFAHGPTRVKVKESIDINASADKVWAVIKDFDQLQEWLPAVKSSKATGGNSDGATRVLTLGNGGSITEELKSHSDKKMAMKYKITDMSVAQTVHHELSGEDVDVPVLPVENYSASLSVKEKAGVSTVTWKAAFYRAFLNNEPPAEMNEEAGLAAVSGVFKGGLENLKRIVEAN
jgi:mxaD protein